MNSSVRPLLSENVLGLANFSVGIFPMNPNRVKYFGLMERLSLQIHQTQPCEFEYLPNLLHILKAKYL